MFRLTAAVLICVIGYLSGQTMTEMLKKKECAAENIALLVDKTEYLVRERNLNIYEIFDQLRKNNSLNRFKFVQQFPKTFDVNTDIRSVMNGLIKADKGIQAEERELLQRFAERIGTSDSQGQAAFLESLAREAAALTERRKAEFREKSRLYNSVGLLFGVMAGILII